MATTKTTKLEKLADEAAKLAKSKATKAETKTDASNGKLASLVTKQATKAETKTDASNGKLASLVTKQATKANRGSVRLTTDRSAGRDALGCRIGAQTNVANAVMYRLTVEKKSFTNAEIEAEMKKLLPDAISIRPSSPHVHHLKALGYAENVERGQWRLSAAAIKLIEATAKLADKHDELASEAKK